MLNRRLTVPGRLLVVFAFTGCSGDVPELSRLGCKWQVDERVETLPDMCGMVVAEGEALIVREGEDAACDTGEPHCLWLESGESALILENTLSLQGHRAWIQDWPCDRPLTCDDARGR